MYIWLSQQRLCELIGRTPYYTFQWSNGGLASLQLAKECLRYNRFSSEEYSKTYTDDLIAPIIKYHRLIGNPRKTEDEILREYHHRRIAYLAYNKDYFNYPIALQYRSDSKFTPFFIEDGWHRFHAAVLNEEELIPCEFKEDLGYDVNTPRILANWRRP